jgi:hypothetical protein
MTITKQMQDCIDECNACHDICQETLVHCLRKGGKHAEAGHIRLLIDCAEVCKLSAGFMLRNSNLHGETCRTCSVICEMCSQSCHQMAEEDARMKACADQCSSCASSCDLMARSAPQIAA